MKNKYHFTISFSDLTHKKQMEIKDCLEKEINIEDTFGYLIDRSDVDEFDKYRWKAVDEACNKSWTELEVVVNGN